MKTGFQHVFFAACVTCISATTAVYAADINDNQGTVTAPDPASTVSPDNISNPAKPVLVQTSSPEFTIRLQSNPSTGFSWYLKGCDQNLVQVTGHKFFPAQAQQAGAPGYEEWSFKATPAALAAPRVTHITLVYARPSAIDQSTTKARFTVITR